MERIVWHGGEWLRQKRKDLGLSAERLAQAMQVGRETVVRLEANRSDPAYSTLVKLGRATGTSIEEIARIGQG